MVTGMGTTMGRFRVEIRWHEGNTVVLCDTTTDVIASLMRIDLGRNEATPRDVLLADNGVSVATLRSRQIGPFREFLHAVQRDAELCATELRGVKKCSPES